jgi:hypothetical protein
MIEKKYPKFYLRNISNEQMVELLNKEYPIDLRYNEDLVERVHTQYPLVSKTEIATVIKCVFSSMRDLLFLGKTFNFRRLFIRTRLSLKINSPVVKTRRYTLKVDMRTHRKMRRHVSETR